MKNFSVEAWNECLENKDWSQIEECAEVDEEVQVFTKLITEALDEVAPVKTFSVRSHFRFGLSTETKELMQERDNTSV